MVLKNIIKIGLELTKIRKHTRTRENIYGEQI